MAIDMEKMRSRMTALKSNGNGTSNKFWRPPEGESTIRIVGASSGDPFRDFWFHYNVGDTPGFLSPKKNFGEQCPLDEYVRQLWKEGTEESKRMAKKLSARQRFFAPVLVRGEEDQGVKVWGFGKRAYETLLSLVLNPEYGDITDPQTGTDLVINYGKPAGASFPETKITPRRKSEPLHKKSERAHELLESIPDFDELFAASRKSVTEVQGILDQFLNTEDGLEEVSTQSTNGSDVDRAFSELLS
tara:strand:- start:15002 stop:15736 length:735 start_codon:yes stop_codon:yes gene_type:complete